MNVLKLFWRLKLAIPLAVFLIVSVLLFFYPRPKFAEAATVTILTSGAGTGNQTWNVPSDWNNSNNTVACIGSGGNGAAGSNSISGAGGGSGVGASTTNITLTPGGTATYSIGAAATTTGVSNAVAGARVTFFNGAASSSASLTCDWGKFAN